MGLITTESPNQEAEVTAATCMDSRFHRNDGRMSPWIGVITLFPEMFSAISDYGVVGRAIQNGQITLQTWNPRDFTDDPHKTVDDRPYGGGPGMVMKAEPLQKAIHAAKRACHSSPDSKEIPVLYLSPQGKPLTQTDIMRLAKRPKQILLAGRYEGVDERIIETEVDEEWSLGDYVVSGGELPAMVLIDAMARLYPGVLGAEDSAAQDSFSNGLLDCPHYTRPEILSTKTGDLRVPPVLLSGDHRAVARWRLKQALGRTMVRRPELLEQQTLSPEADELLKLFKHEYEQAVKKSS